MLPPTLLARAAALARPPQRAVLGITGPPGAGKSTLAQALVDALGESAVLVAMDGFHLADTALRQLGRADRKGAPDTFDATGFAHLLQRVVARTEEVVWAPRFDRDRELAEAGAVAVPREVPLVVVEGSYLLLDGAFAPVRALLSEVWFLAPDPVVRVEGLRARHIRHGRSPDEAAAWVERTDEPNARRVEATRGLADLVLDAQVLAG